MRKILPLSIVIFGVLLFSGNALADVYEYGVEILEQQINSDTIKFTVINNTDELDEEDPLNELNVVAFAVGNNSAVWASNTNSWYISEQAYWDAGESGCYGIWCYSDYNNIDWMGVDDDNVLPGYTDAFYFDGDDGNPVTPGTSLSGFFGYTDFPPESGFAVLLEDGSVVTGDTTIVPIPGAVWLIGSGLIGIVGVRRKFNK